APNADHVSVLGDFNSWNNHSHPLARRWDGTGIWEGFVPGIGNGSLYKYHVIGRHGSYRMDKGDPYAFAWELAHRTGSASVVWDLAYQWQDSEWMKNRHRANALDAPMSVYELHMGSWRRVPEDGNRSLNYREMADWLPAYLRDTGFTHVEFMPVMEHPFYGSWGYQVTGYFAPTSRYGTPQDFMYLLDRLHQEGVGVIMDWVPSHFPSDEHGLVYFDGTHLYEHADPRKGFHPEWGSCIFNYGRHEVRSFLLSSALFWLDLYHADGLRIDAVASMLYLDYARKDGDWIPNEFGGKENLEAIQFLRKMNEEVYRAYPDVQTIAEESTDWPMVSRPVHVGGLGFGLKWNMGWMHDTLFYMSREPIYRKYHQNQLTFSIWYAFTENFMLSISHDEVVYGKGSLINKMPGDDWQKFANLRLLMGYLYAHPGKKLLFMGSEFGQWAEWNHDSSLNWDLFSQPLNRSAWRWFQDLNALYKKEGALFEYDFDHRGFEWIDCGDWESSVLSFIRKGRSPEGTLLVACNFTPVPRHNYRIGAPVGGFWKELLNSDALEYGGSGMGNLGGVHADDVPCHGRQHSVVITMPPLSMVIFKVWSDQCRM
ncbi:MAG: 1,4-alpha-glucan branching protein GlgB, partial [Nitrospirota bacterium]|nr:1,4-alpha-glucan branching protein GlgB [Nitrospirota bacterium]